MSQLILRLFAIMLIAIAIGAINSAPTLTQAQYDANQIDWKKGQVGAHVRNSKNILPEYALATTLVYQDSGIDQRLPSHL